MGLKAVCSQIRRVVRQGPSSLTDFPALGVVSAAVPPIRGQVLPNMSNLSFNEIQKLITRFYMETDYNARALEIAMHTFMQAIYEVMPETRSGELRRLSQMRNANKKSGSVGDIEIIEGDFIIEAWDAKFLKPGIRDEVEELKDKLDVQPNVVKAGFVGEKPFHLDDDTKERMEELSSIYDVDIQAMSMENWLSYEMGAISRENKNKIGQAWLRALVESLGQKRRNIAPIDEPCEIWLNKIINDFFF